jgi:hypothetical protein
MKLADSWYRDFAGRWALVSCAGQDGRSESDDVYQENTEGRDVGAMQRKYSSCGDAPLEMYEFLGCRGAWVNRATLGTYKQGHNIVVLAGHKARRNPMFSNTFMRGDVLVVWNLPDTSDAHAIIVLSQSGGFLDTVEYGQPGAARRERRLTSYAGGGVLVGGRVARVWLPLIDVLTAEEVAGTLVAPDPVQVGVLEAYPEDERRHER